VGVLSSTPANPPDEAVARFRPHRREAYGLVLSATGSAGNGVIRWTPSEVRGLAGRLPQSLLCIIEKLRGGSRWVGPRPARAGR
jgi:hypothetical protein